MMFWIITVAAVLLSAYWRLWLGGTPRFVPIKSGLTWLQYAVGLAIAGGAVWLLTHDWKLSAIAAVGYLAIWRGYGHGPMLQVPLGPSPGARQLQPRHGGLRGQRRAGLRTHGRRAACVPDAAREDVMTMGTLTVSRSAASSTATLFAKLSRRRGAVGLEVVLPGRPLEKCGERIDVWWTPGWTK